MAMKRRPATAEEVCVFFETEPIGEAQLVHRLVGATLKRRDLSSGLFSGRVKPPKREKKAAAPTVIPAVGSAPATVGP